LKKLVRSFVKPGGIDRFVAGKEIRDSLLVVVQAKRRGGLGMPATDVVRVFLPRFEQYHLHLRPLISQRLVAAGQPHRQRLRSTPVVKENLPPQGIEVFELSPGLTDLRRRMI